MWAVLGPIIVAAVNAAAGFLFNKYVKSQNRRQQILSYADAAFFVAEKLPIEGKEKYLRFIEQIVDSLKASNMEPLTGEEFAMLKQLAQTKALLNKPVQAKPLVLPLPPPPPHQ